MQSTQKISQKIAREAPGRLIQAAVNVYAGHVRRSVYHDELPSLPDYVLDAVRETIQMLATFGSDSMHTRRTIVVSEFLIRLELRLSMDDKTVGAVLRHTRKLFDDALPTLQ